MLKEFHGLPYGGDCKDNGEETILIIEPDQVIMDPGKPDQPQRIPGMDDIENTDLPNF
jgi:hypothetical protein